ncbi:hypothetical protein A2U01_0105752, partial [Trifolium medium]|nr:hypothetical protein [Trifolium medium]
DCIISQRRVYPLSILQRRGSRGITQLPNPTAGKSTHGELRRAQNPRRPGELL